MKGHWLSQTRKLNRHYQDGELEEEEKEEKKDPDKKTWDGEKPLIPVTALVAPFYGVFINGAFSPYIDVEKYSYTQSNVHDIQYAKVDVDVRPYIPRVSQNYNENYYDWNEEVIHGQHMEQGKQTPLKWFTHKDGCIIKKWSENGVFSEDIGSIPGGVDLSVQQFDLIKPKYDLYLLRIRKKEGMQTYYNIKDLCDKWSSDSIPYDFEVEDTSHHDKKFNWVAFSKRGLYGYFGEEPKGDLYMRSTMASRYSFQNPIIQYHKTKYKFLAGGTPPTSPSTETSWAGKQEVSSWDTGDVSASCYTQSGDLPGFKYRKYDTTEFIEIHMGIEHKVSEYLYSKIFILKGLTHMKGTIVG